MPDETYYTLLELSEQATAAEIKAAYRNLIKQVHPDTISNLPPYLRAMAEEKSKELTEAYSVLSNISKRRQYDGLISSYRRAQGRSDAAEASNPRPPAAANTARSTRSSRANKWGQEARKLINWMTRHRGVTLVSALILVFALVTLASLDHAPSVKSTNAIDAALTKSPGGTVGVQSNAALASAATIPPVTLQSDEVSTSSRELRGMYVGTVHNSTAGKTAPMTVFFEGLQGGSLGGCTSITPPLYGSGSLSGTQSGDDVRFTVQNINFQGRRAGARVDGSYVVSGLDGTKQFGQFHLKRRSALGSNSHCNDGVLTDDSKSVGVEVAAATVPLSNANVVREGQNVAVVTENYAELNKRCAFLPADNYGRCGFAPETVAQLKMGDHLRVLSSLTRAENGKDILKVKTEQGWVGWIDANYVSLQAK
jgi:DnaJ domain